jgi:hypothetical protein
MIESSCSVSIFEDLIIVIGQAEGGVLFARRENLFVNPRSVSSRANLVLEFVGVQFSD